jgi:AcrR family transcriptional regulator
MPTSTREERRQRRSERRREEILEAAAAVFAAKGYHNATTREIAEAADLAEGTIFNYFASKQELLQAVLEQGAARMRALVVHLDPQQPLRQALTGLLAAALGYFIDSRTYLQALAAEALTNPQVLEAHVLPRLRLMQVSLQSMLGAQIDLGRLRPMDTEVAARLVMGMVSALILPIVLGVQPPPGPEERQRLAGDIVGLLLDGTGVDGKT